MNAANTAFTLPARRPVCPKCQTRVCMSDICNPATPATAEERAVEVARSARCLADAAAHLATVRTAAAMAETRLANAIERDDAHDIISRENAVDRAWDAVTRVFEFYQSCLVADLKTRTN